MRNLIFIFTVLIQFQIFAQNIKSKFPPVFPGCEFYKKKQAKICFEKKMKEHIRKNFQYPSIAIDSGYQGIVIVKFDLGENGLVENISAESRYLVLKEEAIRIFLKLPKMKPAKTKKGLPIKISFKIPITFRLE